MKIPSSDAIPAASRVTLYVVLGRKSPSVGLQLNVYPPGVPPSAISPATSAPSGSVTWRYGARSSHFIIGMSNVAVTAAFTQMFFDSLQLFHGDGDVTTPSLQSTTTFGVAGIVVVENSQE